MYIHMAKKYLLYIHNPKFDGEPQKSQLVNLLLDRHYDYFQPGTLVEELVDHEDLDGSVVGSIELASDLKTVQSNRFDGPLCKVHQLPLDARGRCLQKGCKYA